MAAAVALERRFVAGSVLSGRLASARRLLLRPEKENVMNLHQSGSTPMTSKVLDEL
jgi:hypothetical protein